MLESVNLGYIYIGLGFGLGCRISPSLFGTFWLSGLPFRNKTVSKLCFKFGNRSFKTDNDTHVKFGKVKKLEFTYIMSKFQYHELENIHIHRTIM